MATDWNSIINQLYLDIANSEGSTEAGNPLGNDFARAGRDRLSMIQQLQGAAENPAWVAELDKLLNASFQQQDRGIQQGWAAGQGKHVGNQAGRGLAGSSFDAHGRAGLQATKEGARQQAAQATEQTRVGALQERDNDVSSLVQAILQDDGNLGSAGQAQIAGLANTGNAQAAIAGLNSDIANSNSEMWGGILNGLGEFGASGVRWADRENQSAWNWNRSNPAANQRSTSNSWFGGW